MIVDGWLDWAIQAPGIPDKIYSQQNSGEWITCHSIVGNYQSALSRFLSEEKDAAGRYTRNAAASVMFILCKNGDLLQMYDVHSSTWTSGGEKANTRSWAIEAEGGPQANPSEPFTDAQNATFVRLAREWETYSGKQALPRITLWQHKDVAAQFGYAPTACASDRYETAWQLTTELEEEMPDPRVDKLIAALGGEALIDQWNATGNSLLAGYTIEQADQNDVEAAVAKLQLAALPEHDHIPGRVNR